MKQIIIGISLGIFVASAVYIPFIYDYGKKNMINGIKTGKVVGLSIAANAIKEEFGIFDGMSKYTVMFSVKTTDVIVINKNGNKQIKVIP
jgi:hypothetical protein